MPLLVQPPVAETAEECLAHLAAHGMHHPESSKIALWLLHNRRYLVCIFTSPTLPETVAAKALALFRATDTQFPSNFIKTASSLTDPAHIKRAMALLPQLGDLSIFAPWLRTLSRHADERVRSQSVKLFCTLRPDRELIERQLQSKDPRVRGNAIEGLWNSQTEDATAIFKLALADPHHRVITNGLIGLYLQHDSNALEKLLHQAAHPDPLFRAAAAWAFGQIKESSAIPLLELFLRDPSVMVRKRASKSLQSIRP